MGVFPNFGIDVSATVNEFLTLLREMNEKLDTLIDLQRGEKLARVTSARHAHDQTGLCRWCERRRSVCLESPCAGRRTAHIIATGLDGDDDEPLDELIRNRT